MFVTVQIPHQRPVKVLQWEDSREFCDMLDWAVLKHTPEDIEHIYGDDKPPEILELLKSNEKHVVEIVRGEESEYILESELPKNIYDELADELVRYDMHAGYTFKSISEIEWFLENGSISHQGVSVISQLEELLEQYGADQINNRMKIEVYPDYIETILIALEQKANWHAAQDDREQGDHAIVAWINQIINDLREQTGQ